VIYELFFKAFTNFTDTLTLKYESTTVELDYKGIAWPTDKSSKFKNPPYTKDLCDAEGMSLFSRKKFHLNIAISFIIIDFL